MAGYRGNTNTLRAIASENLQKPAITAAIKATYKPVRSAAVMDRHERQALLTAIARGEQHRFDSKDRLRAVELLGKMQGDYLERRQVDMKISERPSSIAELRVRLKNVLQEIDDDGE